MLPSQSKAAAVKIVPADQKHFRFFGGRLETIPDIETILSHG
jgi:hypothetical protein